ncbi:uncharacterized protein LOC125770894 isoform X2 [Anopheles funestus]|uniref:uncharacterized protein LOC125770894 isoform X2 n=1 Tax=Anopheles funestus TaxID=62324 RepID=UPI0020C715B8|nr:uncharacterized protein LOC125770894 isoform X2 [Anopheles funestus]
MSSIPLKRSRKVTNRANKMLAALEAEYDREQNLHAEVPGPSRMVTQNSDPTSQGENQPQEMEDSSQLPEPIDTSDISFNFSGGGVQGDVVLVDNNFVDLDSSVETGDEDDYVGNCSSDSDVEDMVGECTAAHNCTNHRNISDCLRDWAVVHNQPRSSINEILAIFRKWTALPLPKDSRTLLKTSTTIGKEIRTLEGGEFWYKGIENKLNSYFQSTVPSTDQLTIMLSTDGLPLHRSATTQLWPILMKVEELPLAPIMMISMFCGPEKPTSLEVFLRPLVEEMKEIHQRGLRFGDKVVQLKIRAIIADSPARAFIKGFYHYVKQLHLIEILIH